MKLRTISLRKHIKYETKDYFFSVEKIVFNITLDDQVLVYTWSRKFVTWQPTQIKHYSFKL